MKTMIYSHNKLYKYSGLDYLGNKLKYIFKPSLIYGDGVAYRGKVIRVIEQHLPLPIAEGQELYLLDIESTIIEFNQPDKEEIL